MLVHEGVHLERVTASECDTLDKAKEYANKLMQIIKKLRSVK
jgi:hypothetical protein